MSTRPGWYPDPSGRFPKRWHDGYDWTASVLDAAGQQSYDQLPAAGARPVAGLPAATSAPAVPPRPASTSSPPPPPGASSAPGPSPWAPAESWQSPQRPPAAPSSPSGGSGSWQPGQPWHSSPTQSAQPYTPTTSGSAWQPQQPVTTASLGLTAPPPVRSSGGRNPLVYGLVALGIAGLVLSMFVLDWVSFVGPDGDESAGFLDLFPGGFTPDPFLDKVMVWHFRWLGFVLAGLALLAVLVFVAARSGAHRSGHVIAAIASALGALVSTFSIVRMFRGDGPDPELGVWVLPAGYLVLLIAVVLSARNEPA